MSCTRPTSIDIAIFSDAERQAYGELCRGRERDFNLHANRIPIRAPRHR